MVRNILVIYILISTTLFSQDSNFILTKQIKISELHKIEKEISTFKGIFDYTPYGGPETKIFKNNYNLDLTKPYLYERKNILISSLPLVTRYFYAKYDSLIRVCIYEWFIGNRLKISYINNEYHKIRDYLIVILGPYKTVNNQNKNIESKGIDLNKYIWEQNKRNIVLSLVDETQVKEYSSPTRIRLCIVFQDDKNDKIRYYNQKIFQSYEVDEKPLDIDYINIDVPEKIYTKYKNILKIATIQISNEGQVESIEFQKKHSDDNILKKEIKQLKFKPAIKSKIKVRCKIIVEVKLNIKET